MLTIAILNHKGGAGKTATAVNLAGAALQAGRRVLLVDMDSQGTATKHLADPNGFAHGTGDWLLRMRPFPKVVQRVRPGGPAGVPGAGCIDLMPGDAGLITAEGRLKDQAQNKRLRALLAQVHEDYDLALIDCGPTFNMLAVNSLLASDRIVCPVDVRPASEDGPAHLHGLVDAFREEEKHNPHVYVLPCIYDMRNGPARRNSLRVEAALRKKYGAHPEGQCLPPVRYDGFIAEAYSQRMTVFEHNPGSRGADDYRRTYDLMMEAEYVTEG